MKVKFDTLTCFEIDTSASEQQLNRTNFTFLATDFNEKNNIMNDDSPIKNIEQNMNSLKIIFIWYD